MKGFIVGLLTVFTISTAFSQSNSEQDESFQKNDYSKNRDWSWQQNSPVTFTPPPPDLVQMVG